MQEWPYIAELTDLPQPDSNIEPLYFTAGDSLIFTRSIGVYPATQGWHLHYSLRGVPGSIIDFDSVAAGQDHSINILPAVTANWVPGKYILEGYAVNVSGERHVFYHGWIVIWPNFQAAGADLDVRSHARKVLDAIEAVMENRATDDALNTDIEGTKIERIPISQLLLFRDRYRAEVKAEEARGKISEGRATGRNIFARFTRVGR